MNAIEHRSPRCVVGFLHTVKIALPQPISVFRRNHSLPALRTPRRSR